MAEEQQYGGFWARLVALILDNAVVFVIMLAAAFCMGVVAGILGMVGLANFIGGLAMIVVPFLYWPVMESSKWQATVGKRLMGLEVTDLEGERLSFVHALLRMLGKIVSSIPFGIGFLIAAFTARKQALHDIIARTLVVRSGPSQLWKILVALIVGGAVLAASGAALFYYVIMPALSGGMEDKMKDAMKGAPQTKTVPAPAPAPKAPEPQAKPPAPAPVAAPAPAVEAAPAPALAAPVTPEPAPMQQPKAAPTPAPVTAVPSRPREAARPAPRPAPVPSQPIGEAGPGCVYKPVMTNEEIARCR